MSDRIRRWWRYWFAPMDWSGPWTRPPRRRRYFVDAERGADEQGAGVTFGRPFRTLQYALDQGNAAEIFVTGTVQIDSPGMVIDGRGAKVTFKRL